jgi:hypothetical protein
MSDPTAPETLPENPMPTEPTPAQVEAIHQRILKQKAHSGGAGWFYWIAGLSLLTSIISLSGGTWSFLAGLGVTQVFDGIALALKNSGTGDWVKGFSLFLDLLAAGTFILLGVFAKKGSTAAYITGMVLYGLDAIILLAFREWFGAGFHAFALIQIWIGFSALRWLNGRSAEAPAAPMAPSAPINEPS